jgi:GTPase
MKPLLAIVGRPNVGKSTLFNRLVRRKIAIVEDVPGVTRDRHYADVEWGEHELTVIDTGGFLPEEKDPLLKEVRAQAQLAIEECDVIVMVVDVRQGLSAADEALAKILRKSGKPTLIAVNKVDSPKQEHELGEFHKIGFKHIFPISAEHNRGVEDLQAVAIDLLPEPPPKAESDSDDENAADKPIRVAVVGRPNVGKSTLINALLGENRVVASPMPGTTTDPIHIELEHQGHKFVLTDTAGIRRKRTIAEKVEQFSVIAALKAMDDADVAVLLLDANELAVDQDAKIAGVAEDKGRAMLVVVNKWDQVAKSKKEESVRDDLKYELKFIAYAPVLFTSALEGKKVEKVLPLVTQLHQQFHFRAQTSHLNRLLEDITDNHPAPFAKGKPIRLYYIAQVGTAPPAFTITANLPSMVPASYKRYITNRIRETFDLRVPIRLMFRERPGRKRSH